MVTAYIGIGSNLGDRYKNCKIAIGRISTLQNTKVISVSEWYENPAVTLDLKEQPDYINGVLKIETAFTPQELLSNLQQIEISMGRPATHAKWSPRVIDLDILFYDDVIMDTNELKIPHPELHKRVFVLKPLCDIEPLLVHPVIGLTIKELLGRLS